MFEASTAQLEAEKKVDNARLQKHAAETERLDKIFAEFLGLARAIVADSELDFEQVAEIVAQSQELFAPEADAWQELKSFVNGLRELQKTVLEEELWESKKQPAKLAEKQLEKAWQKEQARRADYEQQVEPLRQVLREFASLETTRVVRASKIRQLGLELLPSYQAKELEQARLALRNVCDARREAQAYLSESSPGSLVLSVRYLESRIAEVKQGLREEHPSTLPNLAAERSYKLEQIARHKEEEQRLLAREAELRQRIRTLEERLLESE
jgi:hypothetical protein